MFPERPTCHDQDYYGRRLYGDQITEKVFWRPPDLTAEPYAYPYRTCSFCGCIHPEDLLKVLAEGATLHGSDWKYGWPHKFYVEGIPNPNAGRQVRIGGKSWTENGVDHREDIMDEAPEHTTGKWYNVHLEDLSPEAFDKFAPVLSEASGIEWILDPEKGICYRAPHRGFQK